MSAEFIEGVSKEWQERSRKRMARFDMMPPAIRELINEFGLGPVDTCLDIGVKNPRHIRHLITTLNDQALYGNSSTKVVVMRAARMGRLIRSCPDDTREECIAAFLKEACS